MWTVKEAEDFWKSIVKDRDEQIAKLSEEIKQLKQQQAT